MNMAGRRPLSLGNYPANDGLPKLASGARLDRYRLQKKRQGLGRELRWKKGHPIRLENGRLPCGKLANIRVEETPKNHRRLEHPGESGPAGASVWKTGPKICVEDSKLPCGKLRKNPETYDLKRNSGPENSQPSPLAFGPGVNLGLTW